MRNVVYLLLFGLVQPLVYGQTKNKASLFQLRGTIQADTGTVLLLPIGGKDFDPNKTNNYTARIKQGTFVFEGQMAYPGAFQIAFFPAYVSSPFLLEAGSQAIICNIDSLREIPKLATKTMTEQRFYVENYIRPVEQQRERAFDHYLQQKATRTDQRFQDSLQKAYAKQRALLIQKQQTTALNYAKQHPNSYVALWHVVTTMSDGYWPVFDSIYAALSPSIKNTLTAKVLAQRLKSSRTTAIGQMFPNLRLIDIHDQTVSIPVSHRPKYTLVDFWFSHCGPCLEQFPKLRAIFNAYKQKGFDIIGISTDRKADVQTWKKTVKDKQLEWSQYVDLGGKLTTRDLAIRAFPSNFLLDEQGHILKKNLSPVELSQFLSEQL